MSRLSARGDGGRADLDEPVALEYVDEGELVAHLAGAFQHWHANAVESRSWPPLSVGFLVPRWDPVRRWLAAGPRSEPTTVSIRFRGQLARWSAAEIVRRDLPGLAAAARVKASPLLAFTSPCSRRLIGGDPAESLPYLVLFGSQTTAPTHLGTDQTRPTPETADLGDGA